jgi:glyoxylase-like metal-dependent hydrolase (beta-lactamase superfamily II)/rhodanese-related sulfurtransferase
VYFQQFYLSCLAHASYVIADRGQAAVIDPQRDVDQYLDTAQRLGAQIRYVIETHLHADFVSGHRELAARSGAEIVFGARAGAAFPHRGVHDGDSLHIGGVELRAIETPGHTPESISWLVIDDGRPSKLLTGDTLFIGDVGRPDLAGSRGYTSAQMAGMLYDSLHAKILTLPDDIEVWPAHGAGSACGKNISRDTSSTIGMQRRTNWALQPMPRDQFVETLTSGLAAPPRYFPFDAELNRRGPCALEDLSAPPVRPETLDADALLLDVRDPDAFGSRHIAGSINIALDGNFASWCGAVLPFDTPIVVVANDDAAASQALMRLARVGIENVIGRITSLDGFATMSLPQVTVRDLEPIAVLDVRRRAEFWEGHVTGAQNIPLDELPDRLNEIGRDAPLAVICAGGYRSSIASSLLARAGFTNVMNVQGGTEEWMRSNLSGVSKDPE